MKTTNWHELLRYMKEAQESGDRYRFVAAYETMSASKNYNEAMAEMGYSSDMSGLQKFLDKEYKQKFKGVDDDAMLSLGNDISDLAEEIGHWNVARAVHVDEQTGVKRWKTQEEQTTEQMAELEKMSPADMLRRYNRLLLGGETANKDGRHMILGPLAMGLMKRMEADLPRFIGRREMTKNMAERILDGFKQMSTVPADFEHLVKMLEGYVSSETTSQRYEKATKHVSESTRPKAT